VGDNIRNLLVFRWPRSEDWRLWFIIIWNVVLFIPSQFVYRREMFRKSPLRRGLTLLWLLTPIIAFLLLRGMGSSGSFLPRLSPDQAWGGFLLTLVIAIFAIVASFPLGVLLALGRRSQIRGIPARITYGVAALLAVYGLVTSTLPGLGTTQTAVARILAFWPLLIPLLAYLFQRVFKGNVVALFSTLYIEVWRGVPFITVLFMSIILFPILLPPGMEVLGTWRVMAAAALFAAAYLAENVRGGLQSLSQGQYEAADAIGLNTFQKYRFIILPQALRIVIPAIVGQFIGLFKDTTLVAIVGLVEFLGAANLISAQPDWLGVRREPYVFIALIYFVGSAAMAGYSRRLEARLGVGQR
jgi:general L-amino acid transport system permease protein